MNKKKTILFRCDGSREIGLGHIMRCMALAEVFQKDHNCQIFFAISEDSLGKDLVREGKYTVLDHPGILSPSEKENWLSACLDTCQADAIIFDSRDGITQDFVKKISHGGILTISLDDPEDKRLATDMIFYPPVPQVAKMSWEGFQGELFTGWEYVVLRKEFLVDYPKTKRDLPSVLVSMGATDPEKLTLKVVRALANSQGKFITRILLGPGSSVKEQLLSEFSLPDSKFQIIENSANVARLMSESDIAIASFGVTAYELAAMGIPAIFLCLTGDHAESAGIFEKEKIAVSLGLHSRIHLSDIHECLHNYLDKKILQSTDSYDNIRSKLIKSPFIVSDLIMRQLTVQDK